MYILFFILGAFATFIVFLIVGYRSMKKRKRKDPATVLANKMQEYFAKLNAERNILGELRRKNPERCKAFGHAVHDMPVTFWATALAGETGELCNLIKKVERGDNILSIHEQLSKEAADIVIYLDLLCTKLDIDLQAAIIQKFNEVSDRVNSPIKL
jgi:NTP pyrophosphatase (non-canonical NTP hydrolase)